MFKCVKLLPCLVGVCGCLTVSEERSVVGAEDGPRGGGRITRKIQRGVVVAVSILETISETGPGQQRQPSQPSADAQAAAAEAAEAAAMAVAQAAEGSPSTPRATATAAQDVKDAAAAAVSRSVGASLRATEEGVSVAPARRGVGGSAKKQLRVPKPSSAPEVAPLVKREGVGDGGKAEGEREQEEAAYVCARGFVSESDRAGGSTPRKGNALRTCTCHGFVRFGSEPVWSEWKMVSGSTPCAAEEFEGSPLGTEGEVCMCKPLGLIQSVSQDQQQLTANSTGAGMKRGGGGEETDGGNECTVGSACSCHGLARFGSQGKWSVWKPVAGSFTCRADRFGIVDFGTNGFCQCRLTALSKKPEPPRIGLVMASVIAVTVTYFLVSVSLASVRTWNQARQLPPSTTEQVLDSTMSAVNFAPMLCAVFLAVTKRAEALAHGDPALFHLPPAFVQIAVAISAASFCAHAVFWLFSQVPSAAPVRPPEPGQPQPKRAAQSEHLAEADGDSLAATVESASVPEETPLPVDNFTGDWECCRRVWLCLSHLAVGIMHLALDVVFVGVIMMQEPEDVYREEGSPRIAAGTICTLVLAVFYFAVCVLIHVLQSGRTAQPTAVVTSSSSSSHVAELPCADPPLSLFLLEVAKLAGTAMSLAPMLCVLFLGAQLCAEWDEGNGNNSSRGWVEASIYVCTVAVLFQLVLAVVAPFLADAQLHVNANGEWDFVTRNQTVFYVVGFARWVFMTVLYVGVEVVCGSLWSLHHLLPITRLLRHLAGCYFWMYTIQWLVLTLRDLLGGGFTNAIRTLRIAKDIASFCPMLAVLFLESWVRPQHFAEPAGPQGFAQDSMYVATLAFLVQLLIVLLSGIVARSPANMWQRDTRKRDGVAVVLLAGFHAATMILCGSVAVVIGSLFTLTPKNAENSGVLLP